MKKDKLQINLRISPATAKQVDRLVSVSPTYASRNHFIEVAVNALLLRESLKTNKKEYYE